MTIESLVIWLVIGAIAGWLAATIVKGSGFGLMGNIVVGILGAVVGGWAFGALGLTPEGGLIGSLIGATLGAIGLLLILRVVKRA